MSDDDHETRGVPHREAVADGSADTDADRALVAARISAFMKAIDTQAEQPADRKGPL